MRRNPHVAWNQNTSVYTVPVLPLEFLAESGRSTAFGHAGMEWRQYKHVGGKLRKTVCLQLTLYCWNLSS